jgi:hypothetical protein
MWIVRHGIPFKRVEDAEYIDFLAKLQPLNEALGAIYGPLTLTRRVLQYLRDHQREIVQLLRQAPGLIHLAFDLWTSPDLHAISGVTAHFADDKGVNRKALLDLSPFYDSRLPRRRQHSEECV